MRKRFSFSPVVIKLFRQPSKCMTNHMFILLVHCTHMLLSNRGIIPRINFQSHHIFMIIFHTAIECVCVCHFFTANVTINCVQYYRNTFYSSKLIKNTAKKRSSNSFGFLFSIIARSLSLWMRGLKGISDYHLLFRVWVCNIQHIIYIKVDPKKEFKWICERLKFEWNFEYRWNRL